MKIFKIISVFFVGGAMVFGAKDIFKPRDASSYADDYSAVQGAERHADPHRPTRLPGPAKRKP